MKNFRHYFGALAIFAFLFTSCSKENEEGINPDSETATLTFSAIVNDLMANRAAETKQSAGDLPVCSNDDPAYVEIVLSRGGSNVVGNMNEPFRVNLASGQHFTQEVPELELTPSMYSLDYFTVHNAAGNVIWVAPQTGSALGDYVDAALPMNIDLRAGVKKYVDVPVLCFDNRDVNEYGYQFFELDLNRAIEFCVFGNYCAPDGRHYTAAYSIDVWSYANGQRGTQLYDNYANNVTMNSAGDYAASPLCVALPDHEGQDEYYFEITLMDAASYGDVTNRVVRAGVITDNEVRNLFDGEGNLDYYHFRVGCEGNDSPPLLQDPESNVVMYKSCLTPINNSGSMAFAYYEFVNNSLRATVIATGVTPNKMHPQHIHGFTDGSNATCPPASAADDDENGDDRFISLEEGAPFYGPVLLPLNYENGEFPVANAQGHYIYERTFENMSASSFPGPESLATVVHGRMVDGSYVATLPVACGEVTDHMSDM